MEPRGSWNPLKLLFAFDGPIDRGKFWGGYTLLYALVMAVGIPVVSQELWFLLALLVVVTIEAYTALMVKRLWDLNLSGWRTLMVFIPFIGLCTFWQIATKSGVLRIPIQDDPFLRNLLGLPSESSPGGERRLPDSRE